MHILLIEDEMAMREAMVPLLEQQDYRVECAADGEEGLQKALKGNHHLILLDIMLPKLDGFAVCRELRQRGVRTPVMMLTARGEVDDRIRGLDEGADDYLTKPFSGRELAARIRALLRRSEDGDFQSIKTLKIGSATINFEKMHCRNESGEIELNAREFKILQTLAEADGRPVTREEILDRAWEYNAWPSTRNVDNHIVALRAKFESDPSHPQFLLTVHGVGYRLVSDSSNE
jgi:DNA-binding response OmpR family regulator